MLWIRRNCARGNVPFSPETQRQTDVACRWEKRRFSQRAESRSNRTNPESSSKVRTGSMPAAAVSVGTAVSVVSGSVGSGIVSVSGSSVSISGLASAGSGSRAMGGEPSNGSATGMNVRGTGLSTPSVQRLDNNRQMSSKWLLAPDLNPRSPSRVSTPTSSSGGGFPLKIAASTSNTVSASASNRDSQPWVSPCALGRLSTTADVRFAA